MGYFYYSGEEKEKGEPDRKRRQEEQLEKDGELIFDEDSVYEIDLECVKCKKS